MNNKIYYEVYKGNKLIDTDYTILKHDNHLQDIKDIYKRKGYTIKVVGGYSNE